MWEEDQRCCCVLLFRPRDSLERSITSGGDPTETRRRSKSRGLRKTQLLQLLTLLLKGEDDEALLEGDGEGEELVSRVVLVDPSLDLGEPLVLLADVVPLGEVDEVGDGLGGQKLEVVDVLDLEGWGRASVMSPGGDEG